MAQNKKQLSFYDRIEIEDNHKSNQPKLKEANSNTCKKCSKFDNKTRDNCKCSSKYKQAAHKQSL